MYGLRYVALRFFNVYGPRMDVFGAYTGAMRELTDSGPLTFAATWTTPGLEFAAVVTDATPERLRAYTYVFDRKDWLVGVRPWILRPGRYELSVGEVLPAPRPGGFERFRWLSARDVLHVRRGEPVTIELPSRRTLVLDLRLREGLPRRELLPDLAVAPRDVRRDGGSAVVAVHNIGGSAAGPFAVVAQARLEGGDWEEVSRTGVEGLPGIRDFVPVLREVRVPLESAPAGAEIRVVLDPPDEVEEICEENNAAPVR